MQMEAVSGEARSPEEAARRERRSSARNVEPISLALPWCSRNKVLAYESEINDNRSYYAVLAKLKAN